MGAVLGIDAAWTEKNPSGVALAALVDGVWTCLAVAPSYDRFCDLASGRIAAGGQWVPKPAAGAAPVAALLEASRTFLAKARVFPTIDVVAVDMPLSRVPLTARRAGDNAVSRALGRYKCGVHSPKERPGTLGAELTNAFVRRGFPLAVCDGGHPEPALLEVFPHAVLVGLQVEHGGVPLAEARRCLYKVSRSSQHWPKTPIRERVGFLLEQFRMILGWLGREIKIPSFPLPIQEDGMPLASLKPYEDGLDGLACCVQAVRYLEGRARCLGDADGAIWIPDTI